MNSIIVKKSLSIIVIVMILALSIFHWKVSQSSPGSTFIESDSSQIEPPQSIKKSIPDTANFSIPKKRLRIERPSQNKNKQNRSQWSEPTIHEINYKPPKTIYGRRVKYL